MKNFTSCFKEKKFLQFFFNQLRWNNTDRYTEFPYLSICEGERNYIRCDDLPFVFSHVFTKTRRDGIKEEHLAYNNAGDTLSLKFEPDRIVMLPDTGRVYHPAPLRAGSIGLIKSKLAIEFSKHFTFDNGEMNPPTRFDFNGKQYDLDTEWYKSALESRPGV